MARRPSSVSRLSVLFGKIAVELDLLTVEQLNEAIRLQQQAGRATPIGEICVRERFFDNRALDHILQEQRARLATSSRCRRPRLGHRTVRRPGSSRDDADRQTAEVPPTARSLRAWSDRAPDHRIPRRKPGSDTFTHGGIWGPFELKRMLGRGGMAAVYLARNMLLRRLVAVKVPFEGSFGTPKQQARFLTEARSTACLDHPNVVRIYSVGEVDGLPYIEMEYVAGRSLEKLIASGELSTGHVLEIFTLACRGVAAAHEKGIIHRDLKPDNILCSSIRRVVVTDFGLASNPTATLGPEEAHALMGTVGYISPEQLQGRNPDTRSDIYALGVMLFNALTGQMPFSADVPMQVLIAQLRKTAPRLRTVKPDLPGWLDPVVARLLERDPERRYQSVAALLADLADRPQR